MRVRNTTVTAAVAGVLTAGLLTTTSLIAAPAGNASCISVWGIGNNDQCQSVPTSVAIALGKASVAQAFGLYSIAIANGLGLPDPGKPEEHNSAFATTEFFFFPLAGNFAYAQGLGATARPFGYFVAAIAIGTHARAEALDYFNLAVNIGVDNQEPGTAFDSDARATGIGNVAAIIGGRAKAGKSNVAETWGGPFNIAANLFADSGTTLAGLGLSTAFSLGRGGNKVEASGPLAIAGTLLRSNITVTQNGPGIKINEPDATPAPTASIPARRTARGATKIITAHSSASTRDRANGQPASTRANRSS